MVLRPEKSHFVRPKDSLYVSGKVVSTSLTLSFVTGHTGPSDLPTEVPDSLRHSGRQNQTSCCLSWVFRYVVSFLSLVESSLPLPFRFCLSSTCPLFLVTILSHPFRFRIVSPRSYRFTNSRV